MMRVLIGVDQLVNIAFWDGEPDETISARAYREKRLRLMWELDRLFFWQSEHCRECYQWELDRRDLPSDYWQKL